MSGPDGRAAHVVDLLDGALSDYETSCDAMRWTSDTEAAEEVFEYPPGSFGAAFTAIGDDLARMVEVELERLFLFGDRATPPVLQAPRAPGTSPVEDFRAFWDVLPDGPRPPGYPPVGGEVCPPGDRGPVVAFVVDDEFAAEPEPEPRRRGRARRDERPGWQTPYGPRARPRR